MKKNISTFALIFVVMLWGLSFSLTKPLLDYMGVFTFLSYRFAIGGMVLSLILLIKKDFNVNKEVLRDGMIAGALFFAVFSFHTLGLKHTTIAKNAFIVGSAVIFIPFVKIILFKEAQVKATWMQVFVATSGLALITLTGADGAFNFGDAVTVLGTMLLAYYTIFIEKRINNHKPLMFTSVQLLTVGFISIMGMMVFETPTLPATSEHGISLLVMAIFLTGFAYVVSNISQSMIDALSVTIIYTLEPFFAAIFGWFLLSEGISFNTIIGAGLIFTSMLIPTLANRRQLGKSPQTNLQKNAA